MVVCGMNGRVLWVSKCSITPDWKTFEALWPTVLMTRCYDVQRSCDEKLNYFLSLSEIYIKEESHYYFIVRFGWMCCVHEYVNVWRNPSPSLWWIPVSGHTDDLKTRLYLQWIELISQWKYLCFISCLFLFLLLVSELVGISVKLLNGKWLGIV